MLEYEEILSQKYSVLTSGFFISALKELPNVKYVKVYYQWNLLLDMDDNKFVDCYVAASAQYLITNDRHFNPLRSVEFPHIQLLTIEAFQQFVDSK